MMASARCNRWDVCQPKCDRVKDAGQTGHDGEESSASRYSCHATVGMCIVDGTDEE